MTDSSIASRGKGVGRSLDSTFWPEDDVGAYLAGAGGSSTMTRSLARASDAPATAGRPISVIEAPEAHPFRYF